MSFEKILENKGTLVNLIQISKVDNQGYLEVQETVVQAKMIILPLKSEERQFWQEIGISKAEMKAYTDVDLKTGWQVEVDGKRYTIRAYENYGTYKKAILEAME
ncbi:hypothetical protein [Geoglobus acetivorans]|uniref:Phage protein n=1 Tax=Geoglobus acetivorans TaxID=565033 RepID=A0A0A7GCV7_GEOAI|nr:hypothetical protein GACE_2277 [Geoglobus acetivorans]